MLLPGMSREQTSLVVDSGQDPILACALSHNREIDLRFLQSSQHCAVLV